ncbi:MAG: single-stranded-DNA-specific exonuclease RecJ, partial [Anaerolineales bacterium]
AIEQVQHAKSLGFMVVVTDHHHPAETLPPADVIVNPKIPGDTYPFKSFAGVGLAYKLAEAVSELAGIGKPESGLDLVALGTVADLAPLRDENRRLVAQGLERMNRRSRIGLSALVEVAGLKSEITATDIAFRLAPRINAAGRMASAQEPLQLLLTDDKAEAKRLATTLDQHNRRRQAETSRAVERAGQRLLRGPEESTLLFALDEEFHEGVVGLAASRLLEQYYRPVLIARIKEGVVKGSARSVPEFHITEALEACSDLLLEFGGHAAAAGFQLNEEDLSEFYDRMDLYTQEKLEGELLRPSLKVDAVVSPEDLNVGLLDTMEAMKPFGHGNPAPLLVAEAMHVVGHRRVGSDGAHLKMTLHNGERYFDSIGFRLGDRAGEISNRLDVAFQYEWNEYRGTRTDQLNIIDFRQPETA